MLQNSTSGCRYVPELKFRPHEKDNHEERLCDLGAAEILMPALAIQRLALPLSVCIDSLCELASEFSVSVAAVFVRLRGLRLWNCVLSEWHRMVDGSFVLTKLYGGEHHPWEGGSQTTFHLSPLSIITQSSNTHSHS